MAAKKEKEPIWWLASASKYRNREGQWTFSRPAPVSSHSFGWDRKESCFVVRDDLGVAGYVHNRLPMSAELAEGFLCECLRPAFCERFLLAVLPQEDAEEIIRVGGAGLKIHRGYAVLDPSGNQYSSMPGLSLTLLGIQGQRLFLFDGLRRSLSYAVRELSIETIRSELHGRVQATAG